MTHYVIDASALINALTSETPAALALRERLYSATCHAPHLVDAELGQTLRRLVRSGRLANDEAVVLLANGERAIDSRHAHIRELAAGAWGLRDNLSYYDALYAALAQQLDVTLLTSDEKLANSPGLRCQVELV